MLSWMLSYLTPTSKVLVFENAQMKIAMICKSKRECDNGFEVLTCSAYGTCKGDLVGIYKLP